MRTKKRVTGWSEQLEIRLFLSRGFIAGPVDHNPETANEPGPQSEQIVIFGGSRSGGGVTEQPARSQIGSGGLDAVQHAGTDASSATGDSARESHRQASASSVSLPEESVPFSQGTSFNESENYTANDVPVSLPGDLVRTAPGSSAETGDTPATGVDSATFVAAVSQTLETGNIAVIDPVTSAVDASTGGRESKTDTSAIPGRTTFETNSGSSEPTTNLTESPAATSDPDIPGVQTPIRERAADDSGTTVVIPVPVADSPGDDNAADGELTPSGERAPIRDNPRNSDSVTLQQSARPKSSALEPVQDRSEVSSPERTVVTIDPASVEPDSSTVAVTSRTEPSADLNASNANATVAGRDDQLRDSRERDDSQSSDPDFASEPDVPQVIVEHRPDEAPTGDQVLAVRADPVTIPKVVRKTESDSSEPDVESATSLETIEAANDADSSAAASAPSPQARRDETAVQPVQHAEMTRQTTDESPSTGQPDAPEFLTSSSNRNRPPGPGFIVSSRLEFIESAVAQQVGIPSEMPIVVYDAATVGLLMLTLTHINRRSVRPVDPATVPFSEADTGGSPFLPPLFRRRRRRRNTSDTLECSDPDPFGPDANSIETVDERTSIPRVGAQQVDAATDSMFASESVMSLLYTDELGESDGDNGNDLIDQGLLTAGACAAVGAGVALSRSGRRRGRFGKRSLPAAPRYNGPTVRSDV